MRRSLLILSASLTGALTFPLALGQTGQQPTEPGEFAFVKKLSGKPYGSLGFRKRPGIEGQCYTFQSTLKGAYDTVRSELGAPAFQDGVETIVFEKDTPAGRVRVLLFPYFANSVPHSAVLLSGPPEAIKAIQLQYGTIEPGANEEQIYYSRQQDPYIGSHIPTSGPNRSNVVLTWFNSSEVDYTVTLNEYSEHQFDPLEQLPMTIKVPALSKVPIKLTYPTNFDKQDDFEGEWISYTSTSSLGPGPEHVSSMSHPLRITIDPGQGASRTLVIYPANDPSGRPIEIRSLKMTLGVQTLLAKDEVQKSRPGRGFRIPFTFNGDQTHDRIHITCDFRLWPNQRWRASTDR